MQVSLHRDRREWVRRYQGLGGVKFGQTPMYAGEPGRFAYLENLYRDHESGYGAALETIPGFRAIFRGEQPIYGIYFYNSVLVEGGKQMLIHAGDSLWKYGMHNVFTTLPTVTIAEEGLECSLQRATLSIQGEATAERRVSLLSDLELPRGGYTFSVRNLLDTEATCAALCLSISDGQTYMIGEGETCAFSVEQTQSMRLELLLFSQPAPFTHRLELRLDSAAAGSLKLYTGITPQKSCGFQLGARFYLLDGFKFLCYDGDRVQAVAEEGIADVLWQGRDRKRILKQRNMLTIRFHNYFYIEPYYTEAADLTFTLSDRDARAFFAQYLKTDGTWEQFPPAQYTLENGYLVMKGSYNADQRIYEMLLPADMDLLQPYNLRVYCENSEDKTISETGKEAFSVRYPLVPDLTIKRCTIACVHDDRVFLSGNPDCPGCVFYSARGNPGFFGTLDFFEDGGGGSHVTGMTASGDTLLVCLAGDGKDSAAYYHTREYSADDLLGEVYAGTPVAYNLFAPGPCINFAGELTFLACDGLYGVSRRNAFGERTVWRRSDSVDARLGRYDHRDTRACVYSGYLWLLCADGSLFLADSRQTYKNENDVVQYEWYYVSNVGVYREQQYHTGEETQALARGEAFGGQFLPAQVLAADEKTVYFGCEDGTVCAFWFDARSQTGEFAPAHYAQNGRRYPSILLTARDDGEVPHLRKRTVPHSTLVRTGVHSNLQAKVYVRTDQGGTQPLSELRAWGLDFGDLHFEGLSFSAMDSNLFALAEHAGGWMEKQYLFVCDRFLGKFSLAELSYSYRLCGRYRATEAYGG